MPAASLTSRDVATHLTRCALRLLDIPFDPATALNGEAFDRVVESLSEQLSDAAGAELAGQPAPSFTAPRTGPFPPLVTRRAQAGLRRQIESGRLPGNAVSVRRAGEAIDDVRDELRALLIGETGYAVGYALVQEFLHGSRHRRYRVYNAYVVVGGDDVQGHHIGAEELGLFLSKLPPVNAGRFGAFKQRIINVGDVLYERYLYPGIAPCSVQQVKSNIGRSVPHVGRVVGGNTADVQPGAALTLEGLPASGRSIKDGGKGRLPRE